MVASKEHSLQLQKQIRAAARRRGREEQKKRVALKARTKQEREAARIRRHEERNAPEVKALRARQLIANALLRKAEKGLRTKGQRFTMSGRAEAKVKAIAQAEKFHEEGVFSRFVRNLRA